jgi:hypothetical protein
VIKDRMQRFLALHLNNVDAAHHRYGPRSAPAYAAAAVNDGNVDRAGAGIKPGSNVANVVNIDIAPTIARLLGVSLKDARGRVLEEILVESKSSGSRRSGGSTATRRKCEPG